MKKSTLPNDDRAFTASDFQNADVQPPREKVRYGPPRPVEVEDLDNFVKGSWRAMQT